MCKITTCNVKNETDKQAMTLCVEWHETEVKVLIVRHGELPLRGQVVIADLVKAADNFNRSKEEYLADIKQELSGGNPDIQFVLRDNVFLWKKKVWNRGKIICEPLTQIMELSTLFINIVNGISMSQERNTILEKENKKLQKRIGKMEKIMERMTEVKNTIEEELCKRFLILLNSKKNKIRELRNQLHNYTKDPVFDKSTDESDLESSDIDSQPLKRAKMDVNENACGTSSAAVGCSVSTNIVQSVDNTHESDDSFELKLEESQAHGEKILNITDEDPEEDLFSS